MRSLSPEMRKIIGANIRARRVARFPGHGGARRCAEAFGVSPQLWSFWEGGKRTPPDRRLGEIAIFFGIAVDDLRRNGAGGTADPAPFAVTVPHAAGQKRPCRPIAVTGRLPDMPPPDVPESRAGFYRLIRHFLHIVMTDGIRIRLDERDIARIAACRDERFRASQDIT